MLGRGVRIPSGCENKWGLLPNKVEGCRIPRYSSLGGCAQTHLLKNSAPLGPRMRTAGAALSWDGNAGRHHCSFVKRSSHSAGIRSELFSNPGNTIHSTQLRCPTEPLQVAFLCKHPRSSCCRLSKVHKPQPRRGWLQHALCLWLNGPKPALNSLNFYRHSIRWPQAWHSCSQCHLGTQLQVSSHESSSTSGG